MFQKCWENNRTTQEKNYVNWVAQFDTLSLKQKQLLLRDIQTKSTPPLISIILVHGPNTFITQLIGTLQSLTWQNYANWECIVLAPHSRLSLMQYLVLSIWSRIDPRISICRRPHKSVISLPTLLNLGVDHSKGDWIGFLQSADRISDTALLWIAREIVKTPGLQLIYGDEDYLNSNGKRVDPLFKSDWNPEFFLTHHYMGSFLLYRKEIIRKVGSFSEGYPQAEIYDLSCRVIENIGADAIRHIPRILTHHYRSLHLNERYFLLQKMCPPSNPKVIDAHLARLGKNVQVIQDIHGSTNRIRFALPNPLPLISILIPIRDKVELLITCIESIKKKTTYPCVEIIIINNGSVEQSTLKYLKELESDGVRILHHDFPFNYSVLNNLGAQQACGEYLCLLNSDIEILTPEWLEGLLSYACQHDIGCVGAKLWYPDGRLQHGGVVLGIGGVAGHAYKYIDKIDSEAILRLIAPQRISAVTGACLMIAKKKYEALEGLEEGLAVAFNDVDLCLRAMRMGLSNIFNPEVEMIHHESVSRGRDQDPLSKARYQLEFDYMQSFWLKELQNDHFYNPNLTLIAEDFSLAIPPRFGA